MKLDAQALIHVWPEDWKILGAVEKGSSNHEVVPTKLIREILHRRGGGFSEAGISRLAKANLIARLRNAKYDGYRLTYGGLDYLALQSHKKANIIYSVGNQFGVGKESDIIAVADSTGKQYVLKIHRLGRISFRSVKSNRDYDRKQNSCNWMDLSRLAAEKEHAFMKSLHEAGFPVPTPIAHNRHTVVMEMINSFPLRQVAKDEVTNPAELYAELMNLILRLAGVGLIHGDFNEFNLLIKVERLAEPSATTDGASAEELKLTPFVIDFPQMVSVDHSNAEMYFDRDVDCIKTFFKRRFGFTSEEPGPFLKDARKALKSKKHEERLDVIVKASGFYRNGAKRLQHFEQYLEEAHARGDAQQDSDADEDGDENEDEDKDEDEEIDESNKALPTADIEGHASATVDIASGTDHHQGKVHDTTKAFDCLVVT